MGRMGVSDGLRRIVDRSKGAWRRLGTQRALRIEGGRWKRAVEEGGKQQSASFIVYRKRAAFGTDDTIRVIEFTAARRRLIEYLTQVVVAVHCHDQLLLDVAAATCTLSDLIASICPDGGLHHRQFFFEFLKKFLADDQVFNHGTKDHDHAVPKRPPRRRSRRGTNDEGGTRPDSKASDWSNKVGEASGDCGGRVSASDDASEGQKKCESPERRQETVAQAKGRTPAERRRWHIEAMRATWPASGAIHPGRGHCKGRGDIDEHGRIDISEYVQAMVMSVYSLPFYRYQNKMQCAGDRVILGGRRPTSTGRCKC